MLGEKRSQSLFAPKASAEKAAATHITTGPDGRKKELPLYFGPDCPVSGNMGQNQHEAGVGEPQPADEPLRHAPADDGTGVEADPTDSVNMAEDLPRRSLNTESAGGYRAHSLFFTPENEGQDFNTVLQDVQEYISGKYSALITEGGDEDAKAQIKRYITKYVQDRRIAVKGYSGDQLVDALYTEMAEFGLLTKYIFGTGIEEINVNSWRDIEVLYANGETVKLEEHFDSPEHAVNVIRRMLHVSGKERGSQSVPRSAHTAPQCGPGNGFAGVTFQGMGSHRGSPRLEWPITSAFIRHYNRDMDRKGGTKAKYGRHSALK